LLESDFAQLFPKMSPAIGVGWDWPWADHTPDDCPDWPVHPNPVCAGLGACEGEGRVMGFGRRWGWSVIQAINAIRTMGAFKPGGSRVTNSHKP